MTEHPSASIIAMPMDLRFKVDGMSKICRSSHSSVKPQCHKTKLLDVTNVHTRL